MALKLSLKPGEKFVVNGAVMMNGDRRGVLVLQNKASILREKDIMQPHDVNTPAKHIYFPIMMMYLEQDNQPKYYDEFVRRTGEFMGAVISPDIMTACVAISRDVMAGEYYKALLRCRKIIEWEEERLGHVAQGVSESSEPG